VEDIAKVIVLPPGIKTIGITQQQEGQQGCAGPDDLQLPAATTNRFVAYRAFHRLYCSL
jgi:hypothetical protein